MALIDQLLAVRIAFVLGIVNIVGLMLVLFSCRCILGWRPQVLQRQKWFMVFYRNHCWYWRLFLLSVFLHAMLAFVGFGNPF
ncbi:TPA: hypothetical protein HA231_03320 [Candidatus Woesearchaeota archaeon]|nr:hypothetical protein [Candidatus Woesearchaeota archaeon]